MRLLYKWTLHKWVGNRWFSMKLHRMKQMGGVGEGKKINWWEQNASEMYEWNKNFHLKMHFLVFWAITKMAKKPNIMWNCSVFISRISITQIKFLTNLRGFPQFSTTLNYRECEPYRNGNIKNFANVVANTYVFYKMPMEIHKSFSTGIHIRMLDIIHLNRQPPAPHYSGAVFRVFTRRISDVNRACLV